MGVLCWLQTCGETILSHNLNALEQPSPGEILEREMGTIATPIGLDQLGIT